MAGRWPSKVCPSRIQVRSSAVEALHKSHIESIAALLASQDEVPAAALQELTYRRSLRVALDVLNEDSRPGGEGTSPWQGDKPPRADPASRAPDAPPPCVLPAQPAARPGLERRPGPAVQSLQASADRQPPGQVDLEQGPPKSGDPSMPSLLPAGAVFVEGGGSRLRHGHETPARKRQWHSAENAEPGCAGPDSLGQGDGLCAHLGGQDPPEMPSSRARSAKKPRLDGGQSPPVTPTAGTASGSGEPRLPPTGSPSPRPLKLLEEDLPSSSSEESVEFNSISSLLEEEDEEELPRILLYHEPRSFEVGMLVWLKYQKYPFWPAVVKSIRRRDKKASVLFIEGNMNPKGRGITVSLRRLKHFDCADKHALLDRAKEDYAQAIGWCVSLITDYRVRLGCGSFAGSFLEYYAADISYPVRKSIQQDVLGTRFPQLGQEDPMEPVAHSPPGRPQPCRKVLPDRSRAARDRANQRLVEFIVNARGAESHLHAVLKRGRPSRWLRTFLRSGQHVTCVETYLEDDAQLDAVVKYLQGVCQDAGGGVPAQGGGDRIRFILDVLLPEAIICAISAVDSVDYKTAEQKYIQGPTLSYREKEIFDKELLEERNRRRW